MTDTSSSYKLTGGGGAGGRILSFSHIVLISRDMNETVKFYRDVMGLKVASTRRVELAVGEAGELRQVREYFFETASGEALGFYELPDSPGGHLTTPLSNWFWPGTTPSPARPHKLDHLCFHVATEADVNFFMERLTDHGIEFIGPFLPRATGFTQRIYFWDPSGNPLEMATLTENYYEDLAAHPERFIGDDDPVPSLMAG